MEDLMLDIETMGVEYDAAIIQIGACYFNRYTGEISKVFCENINLKESVAKGFTVNKSTEEWWQQQNQDILNDILTNNKSPEMVADNFANFLGNPYRRGLSVWSHATFDFVLVNNFLKAFGKKPMNYKSAKDIRTLVDLSGINLNNYDWGAGKTHNALDDCKFQVQYCVDAFNKLKSERQAA